MARPKKYNADYFPHNNNLRNDRRCKALRSKFNLEGYAVFVMLLETLTGANHFQIEDNKMESELIAGDIDIDSKKLNAILEYLIKLGLLVKQGDLISSPMLNDLKNILNDVRDKDRNRKVSENPTKENRVFQSENGVIQAENTQSKVKNSKVNKREEKEIKEKGNKENSPPIFFDFSFSEKTENNSVLHSAPNQETETAQEKSSAKKDNNTFLLHCEKVFERFSPQYVWESKDREQLSLLLQKICITKPDVKSENQLAEAFQSFLQKLPEYWRTKKFTIPNLNYNYNEIVSEIRSAKKSLPEKKYVLKQAIFSKAPEIIREPSAEENQKTRTAFIQSICENFENFIATGETSFVPLWAMYDTLVEENVLKLSAKKLDLYRKQAEKESDPKNKNDVGYSSKNKTEIILKSLAVKDFFNELKKNKADIKTLFKK